MDKYGPSLLVHIKEDLLDKNIKKTTALAFTPFILGVTALVGYLIGSWLDSVFDTKPYLTYLFLALGFIAGIREIYRVIKKFGHDN